MKARLNIAAFGLAVSLALLSLPMDGNAAAQMPPVAGPAHGSRDASVAEDPAAKRYAIQVAAFKTLSRAQKKMTQLTAAGCRPFYRHEDTGAKGKWYRVYAGSYTTPTQARESAARLKREGVIDWHTLRRIDADGDLHFAAADPPAAKGPAVSSPSAPAPAADIHAVGKLSETVERAAAETTRNPKRPAGGPDVSPAVPLSLLDAILYSMEGNREIQVVAFTPQQSQEDVTSAEAVYDTRLFAEASYRRDPNLESSVFDIVTEDQGLTQTGVRKQLKTGTSISTYLETRYSDLNNAETKRRYKHIVAPTMELRQHLLNNIGSRKEKTAIKIANYQANISEEEFRQTAIAVTNRVAQAYWKLYQFKALIDISRQNFEMAEEICRRETERLNRGLSQPLDVARAQSSLQQRRSSLLRAQEEYNIAMDRLKLLINWEQFRLATDIDVVPIEAPRTAPLVVDEAEAIAQALANRSEILKAKQEQMIRQADEDLAAHQRLPTFDAYGRYSVSGYDGDFKGAANDINFNDEDIWEVGVNFEWPIGNRAANARLRQKVLARRQMETIIQRIEDEIRLDVKQALYGIDTARGEIQATRLARDAAVKVVDGEATRFDIGQTSNLELLRAQDLLALNSRNFTRAVVDYNLALHELERAQGVLPKGVTIEKP